MTFPMIRPDMEWVGNILGTELQIFDRNLSRAIDGHGGGTYAPSTQITLGGAGLKVTGAFQVSSTAAFLAGMAVVGTSGFTGLTVFANTGALAVDVQAGGIKVAGGAEIDALGVDGVLAVEGLGLFGDDVTVAGDLSVGGGAVFAGATVFDGTAFFNSTGGGILPAASFGGVAQFNAEVVLSGAGRIRRRVVAVTDTNMTLSVEQADVFIEHPANIITGNRTFTLSANGAFNGSSLKVFLDHSSGTVSFVSGGETVHSQPPGEVCIDFIFWSGRWRPIQAA